MNIFSTLKIYKTKWQKREERNFSQEELDAVDKAEVVESNYGNSVCMFLKAGGTAYIPCDTESDLSVGDVVDLSKRKLRTYGRADSEDIYRVL